MKIYTRGGDEGQTSLLGGERVPKHHLRVEAYGTFDELNSWIGYARAINSDPEVETALAWLQPHLHLLCSDIAAPHSPPYQGGGGGDQDSKARRSESGVDHSTRTLRIQSGEDTTLEREIDSMERDLTPLTHFILPGGGLVGAALHLARTVCRRGERKLIELATTEGSVNPEAVKFVNRLSDYLFTLARWANKRDGFEETIWEGGE
jgi:cob(I)alamin adenosyltransferase